MAFVSRSLSPLDLLSVQKGIWDGLVEEGVEIVWQSFSSLCYCSCKIFPKKINIKTFFTFFFYFYITLLTFYYLNKKNTIKQNFCTFHSTFSPFLYHKHLLFFSFSFFFFKSTTVSKQKALTNKPVKASFCLSDVRLGFL
jgi:hypothetical protein